MANLNRYERRFDRDEAFWDQYVKGRPAMPDSFLQKIYDYHTQHGGTFGIVHDAGAGPGIHTERLAATFDRIILSDPSPGNVDLAKKRLSHLQQRCDFRVGDFEDVEGLQENSVDLIVGFNMLHFCDLEAAMKAADFQLKPGGTLALATFCYAVLDDDKAQKIWEEIFQRGAEALIKQRGELDNSDMRRGRTVLSNDFDIVPVPETYFRPGVVRSKINYPAGYSYASMLIPKQHTEVYSFPSKVGPNDHCESVQDDAWKVSRDIHGWKELFASHPLQAASVDDLWEKFETISGDREMPGKWAAHLILATKK